MTGTVRKAGRKIGAEAPKAIGLIGLARYGSDERFLHGFYRFCKPRKAWLIHDAGHHRERIDTVLKQPLDAIIAHAYDHAIALQLRAYGRPVIDLSGIVENSGFITIRPDDRAIGVAAAKYFLERRFRSFAFVSPSQFLFEQLRYEGYAAELRKAGFAAPWFTIPDPADVGRIVDNGGMTGVGRTIADLLHPLAVFASSDTEGEIVCDKCRAMGLKVPDQVSILGVDDDPLVCNRTLPPMSSVRVPCEKMGFDAARLMDQIFRGRAPSPGLRLYPPVDVHARASTDLVALDDARVSRAMRYIRDHALDKLRARDVVAYMGGDRRNFEKRFLKVSGSTILTGIHRSRIEAARQMLEESDDTIAVIADKCGFCDAKTFSKRFNLLVGRTPGNYRRRFRSSPH